MSTLFEERNTGKKLAEMAAELIVDGRGKVDPPENADFDVKVARVFRPASQVEAAVSKRLDDVVNAAG